MINIIEGMDKVHIPEKKFVISNYIMFKFDKGNLILGIDKEDILQWIKDMENPNEIS